MRKRVKRVSGGRLVGALQPAPWADRLGANALMVAALVAASYVVDVYRDPDDGDDARVLTPVLSLALVAWAVASRRLADGPRRAWLGVAIVLACGLFTLLRTEGITGDGEAQLAWQWTHRPRSGSSRADRRRSRARGHPRPVFTGSRRFSGSKLWPLRRPHTGTRVARLEQCHGPGRHRSFRPGPGY
jgi:hypothetical protein